MIKFLELALQTARKGYPVFPVKPGQKVPIYDGGFKIATRDEAKIREWWTQHPDANIGIPTGSASGLVVVDVDPRNGGNESCKALFQNHGGQPNTPILRTPSGGIHLYFQYKDGLRNSASKIGNGLDIRGEGGYVVADGSVVNGKEYKWIGWGLGVATAKPFPDWLYEMAVKPEPPKNLTTADGFVPEGKRNDTLVRLAGHLRKQGLSADVIRLALLKHNEEVCMPPLPEEEVYRIANQADGWERGTDNSDQDLPDANRLLSQFVRPEDWLDIPEPPMEWIIEDLLAEDSLTMLSAYPKEGKSTFARHLAVAVAKGEDFLGRPTKQGKVLYFALEEMERDVRAKFRALGIEKGDPLLLRFHSAYPSILADLRELLKTEKPLLIVIDTLVRLPKPKFESGDSSGGYFAVGSWFDPLLAIAHEDKTAVLGVYHSTKAGRGVEGSDAILSILGTTGMGGAIDQLIYLTQSQDGVRAYGAIGRFPSIAPTLMSFDEDTQRLASIGEKADVKWSEDREAILSAVSEDVWMDREAIKAEVKINNSDLGKHLTYLVDNNWLTTMKGGESGRKNLYQRIANDSTILAPIPESQNQPIEVEVI